MKDVLEPTLRESEGRQRGQAQPVTPLLGMLHSSGIDTLHLLRQLCLPPLLAPRVGQPQAGALSALSSRVCTPCSEGLSSSELEPSPHC